MSAAADQYIDGHYDKTTNRIEIGVTALKPSRPAYARFDVNGVADFCVISQEGQEQGRVAKELARRCGTITTKGSFLYRRDKSIVALSARDASDTGLMLVPKLQIIEADSGTDADADTDTDVASGNEILSAAIESPVSESADFGR
ncbi:hypothetical protein AC578_4235 [Pseudocercospora eumusae]|uniref:Uncharacterized protein n=1 Tax=Pseudocercospora eumusae TaxID=321146 RepID=A0A139H373_9PEZI|nr:hypothetical protein AC578_4235 [Pseudocercospora eumusae]